YQADAAIDGREGQNVGRSYLDVLLPGAREALKDRSAEPRARRRRAQRRATLHERSLERAQKAKITHSLSAPDERMLPLSRTTRRRQSATSRGRTGLPRPQWRRRRPARRGSGPERREPLLRPP